jgi:hypothetical protein
MHNTEYKLIRDAKGLKQPNEVSAALLKLIEKPGYRTIKVGPKVNLKTVVKQLESTGLDISVRNGVSGGCYGMRDGKSYEGMTLWLHPKDLPERVIDDEGDELVNIYKLIESNGGELIEGLDGEKFEEIAENLGHDVKGDNTYNYSGNSDAPQFMFDADYAVIESDKTCFLSIKFHCGGDVRGNYTDKVVYKFESIDDLYSVLMPSFELKEGE